MNIRGAALSEVWRESAALLRESGAFAPKADAELLLLHVLGISKTELLRDWREPFPPARREAWGQALARKLAGEPVQYITGEVSFYGRGFAVTPATLIPRPETELLAEAVLQSADAIWPDAGAGALRVLDVGTGSGALAVTLAAERPSWRVTASDLSPDALAAARRNAERHEVAGRIRFVQGDLLAPFTAEAGAEPIDILVSNPPYIPSDDIPGLQREVRDHEPRLALDGGADGLMPYRRMAEQLPQLPRLPRLIAWEVGIGQAEDAANLLRASADWREVRFVPDYAGIQRHVIAIR